MSGRVFLDTNVFVYLLDPQEKTKATLAQRLLTNMMETKRGVVSDQVEREFFNVAFRRFRPSMNAAEAEETHRSLFGKMQRVANSDAMLVNALRLKDRYLLPWYDSLIISAALEAGCSILCSEDFQPGQVFGETLTVLNPFAFHKN